MYNLSLNPDPSKQRVPITMNDRPHMGNQYGD